MAIDPITVEIIRCALKAAANEMSAVLKKTAYNMMIYEVRDFCCGLIDAEGRMISQNRGGLPIFLADLGIAVKDGIARYGLSGFKPGDVMIIDATGRRRLVVVTNWGSIALSSLLAAQAFLGLRLLWPLYTLVAAQSLLGAVGAPARRTFVPRLLAAVITVTAVTAAVVVLISALR